MGLDLDLELALSLQLRSSPAHVSFFFSLLGKNHPMDRDPHRRRNGYLHKLGKGALGVTKKEFDRIYFTFGYLS